MEPKLIYIIVAFVVEVLAYGLLVGLCAKVTLDAYGTISTLSDAFALSVDVTGYYTFIIYVFTVGRNGYEFYIDPYGRINAWKTNRGLYAAIVIRIIFLNGLMLFLFLIGSISINRSSYTHNIMAMMAIIFHFLYEFTCIGIRSYYAQVGCYQLIGSLAGYITLLVLEGLLVIAAIMFALCFISVFDTCPANSTVVFISEYMLFAIVIITPVFRVLDASICMVWPPRLSFVGV